MLHHLIAGITIGRGNGAAYLDAMERELGVAGRLLGLGVLDNLLPLLWETQPERFPLAGVVLDHAHGLIVHSDYVARTRAPPGTRAGSGAIPHPVWPPAHVEPATDVSGDPLIGCFGFLNMNKRIPQLLEAFASLRRRRPGARLLLVGAAGERFDVGRRLERLGLTDGVERLDYVPEERMWSLMAACDVLVNLRYPTMGETSGSVIRALSLGKPLLVSDVGWFSELPDDAVLKVPVDEFEVRDARGCARRSPPTTARRSARPRARTSSASTPSPRVADAYAVALETAAGGDASTTRCSGGSPRPPPRSASTTPPRSRAPPSTPGSSREPRRGARALGGARRGVWLAAIVVVSSAVRDRCSRDRIVAPWIMVDELIYSELAKSLAAHGHFLVRGVPSTGYGFVYPVLIAPALAALHVGPDARTHAAKAINAVVMSLAAVPAYFLARRLLSRRGSRSAPRRSRVLVPSMLYTGMLMTENAFYPLFLLACARARADARAADARCASSCCSRSCGARVRDARAGGRALPGGARRAAAARADRARPARAAPRRSRRSTASLGGAAVLALVGDGRARPLAALAARRLPRRDAQRLLASARSRTTCSGTSPSSTSTSA